MTTRNSTSRLQRWFIANLLVFGCITGARAQTLANDLVAYWPLDEVQGNKTPDLVSGYDMTLNNLTHLFFAAIGATQGTNNVRFDDFYLSSNGFNSTTPVTASSFQQVTTIQIGPFAYNPAAATFTLSWSSTLGATYNVLKKTSLSDPSWTTLATGYPAGGATGTSTSYTDSSASQAA